LTAIGYLTSNQGRGSEVGPIGRPRWAFLAKYITRVKTKIGHPGPDLVKFRYILGVRSV